ncbi:MAG TPA: SH3 domain-containing protein, partial [Thermoflexales bacterium]|nr:SH3 domain-containing protein [Thermoflexales bacterium]
MMRWKLLLGLIICVGLAFAGIYLLANAAKTLNAPTAEPVITLYPQTPAPSPAPTQQAVETPLPPTPSPLPPTPALKKYTVQSGDTMLDIALKNGVSLDALSAANPGINPVLLQIGAVLNIPAPGQVAQAPAQVQRTHEITADAEVSSNDAVQQNGGLNLRNQPGFDTSIVGQLPVFTPVKIIGRSEDAAWAQVKTDDGKTGWVFVLY